MNAPCPDGDTSLLIQRPGGDPMFAQSAKLPKRQCVISSTPNSTQPPFTTWPPISQCGKSWRSSAHIIRR